MDGFTTKMEVMITPPLSANPFPMPKDRALMRVDLYPLHARPSSCPRPPARIAFPRISSCIRKRFKYMHDERNAEHDGHKSFHVRTTTTRAG